MVLMSNMNNDLLFQQLLSLRNIDAALSSIHDPLSLQVIELKMSYRKMATKVHPFGCHQVSTTTATTLPAR